MNWAFVEPAGIVTVLEGTFAIAVLLLAIFTTRPFVGAGPLSVTVAIEVLPPTTDVGFNPIEFGAGGFKVRAAVRELDK